jgi:antitoxin component YwqK of YwqJK toxin-antitoxin module
MKNYLLLILLLVSSAKAFACSCEMMRPFQTSNDLIAYEFIAHVKIVNDHDGYAPSKPNGDLFDKVDIQVLELFKGKMTNAIYEVGKDEFCSLDIKNGQEWIFFGVRRNGKLVVSYCDYNLICRQADGQREWEYESGFREIKLLRQIFGIPEKKFVNGKHIEYYENGKIEIEENFENEKRVGERKTWYPTGILKSKKFFVNDSLDGKLERYYPSGQLEELGFFQRGNPYNVHRRYNDTTYFPDHWYNSRDNYELIKDSLMKEHKRLSLSRELVFDAKGEIIVFRKYDPAGKLQLEEIANPETKTITEIHYHDAHYGGLVSSIAYRHVGEYKPFGHYQSYEYDGLPHNSWDYDESGKRINEKIIPRLKKMN